MNEQWPKWLLALPFPLRLPIVVIWTIVTLPLRFFRNKS